MASDTAVAEAPPQAELEQLLPATFQCFTVFGTSQEREIPEALIGLPRRRGAFATWYAAQWKRIRSEVAARGNIFARESIKREADRKRGWQQLPANKVYRNDCARRARRVHKEKVARERRAAELPWIKSYLAKLKRERVRLKELAELRRAKAEENVD